MPAAKLRPNAAWADTVENTKAGSPGDTYQARHIRRYRVLRDTVAAGGIAAVVIAVEQELTLRATSPLASQSATIVTQLHGSEDGTAVFAPGVARLISRDRRGRLEGDQTMEGARRITVPMHYEYSSQLALVR